ncbi:hypothetical protein C0V77_06335 [Emticicia sp. TH156]|nr:hypothetical protein C0V77_06335 [Emticicia sp. TH156]
MSTFGNLELRYSPDSLITGQKEFICKLNKRLYELTRDKHLSIEYNPGYSRSLESGKEDRTSQELKEKTEKYGFTKTEVLTGNIGYLDLDYFADTMHAKKTAFEAVEKVRNTKALIIDLRGNSGGSGSMLQLLLLCSMFFPEINTPILRIA